MLQFKNFPPQGPADVEWAPGARDLIITASNIHPDRCGEDMGLVRAYGNAIGVMLMASLADPSTEMIGAVMHKLTQQDDKLIYNRYKTALRVAAIKTALLLTAPEVDASIHR